MSNNLLDPSEGDQRDWPRIVEGFSASESHPYVENLRYRVQKRGARSSRILSSKCGSRASAEQRCRHHIADYRVWLAMVETREFSGCRDAVLVSLRRSIALALLNVAFGK